MIKRFTPFRFVVQNILLLSFLLATGAFSAMAPSEQTGWFPFSVLDLAGPDTAGSELDLSFLSPEPAGAHGFLKAKGEYLMDDRGQAIRLFGVNLTDFHPLMPKEFAEPSAKRLQQLGINAVRLHYFDWDVEPSGILNKDRQTLNPAKLDQLDNLIAQLGRHGIWVDLNLHVARGYPNMPAGWHAMGKGLDFLHEPYIQSQMQYARDLLGHVNPYTKKRLADDPAIAIIEINNENTALRDWTQWAALPPAFSGALKTSWNAWLRKKYGTTERLLLAWGPGTPLGETELLRNADLRDGIREWNYEKSGGGEGLMEIGESGDGKEIRWVVSKAGAAGHSHQLQQLSVPVADGQTYTLCFTARAKPGTSLAVDLMMQESPWRAIAGTVCKLVETNTSHSISFEVANPTGKALRLNFSCKNMPGVYQLSHLSLRTGAPAAVDAMQRIEDGTVALLSGRYSKAQARDFVAFLSDREIEYITRMKALLKDTLGCRQIIYGTQLTYGGGAGFVREWRTGDAIDAHCYPDHPSEPARSVRNISLTGTGAISLAGLASTRLSGKPYFVTEFDLNPPNDHTAQNFPMISVLAAFQDWAGVFDYAWYNFGTGPGTAHLKSPWVTVGDSAQMAFIPAAAMVFRLGLVKSAKSRINLDTPEESCVALTAKSPAGWEIPSWPNAGVEAGTPWRKGVAVRMLPGEGPSVASEKSPVDLQGLIESDTGEIVFDRKTPGRETLTVNAPACRLATGIVQDQTFRLGDVTLSFSGGLLRSFGQAMVVSLDGKPIDRAAKIFITAGCKSEGTGQAYSPDRTSVNWGKPPMLAFPLRATIKVPGSWTAKIIDGGGKVKSSRPVSDGVLSIDPSDQTMWYVLTRN